MRALADNLLALFVALTLLSSLSARAQQTQDELDRELESVRSSTDDHWLAGSFVGGDGVDIATSSYSTWDTTRGEHRASLASDAAARAHATRYSLAPNGTLFYVDATRTELRVLHADAERAYGEALPGGQFSLRTSSDLLGFADAELQSVAVSGNVVLVCGRFTHIGDVTLLRELAAGEGFIAGSAEDVNSDGFIDENEQPEPTPLGAGESTTQTVLSSLEVPQYTAAPGELEDVAIAAYDIANERWKVVWPAEVDIADSSAQPMATIDCSTLRSYDASGFFTVDEHEAPRTVTDLDDAAAAARTWRLDSSAGIFWDAVADDFASVRTADWQPWMLNYFYVQTQPHYVPHSGDVVFFGRLPAVDEQSSTSDSAIVSGFFSRPINAPAIAVNSTAAGAPDVRVIHSFTLSDVSITDNNGLREVRTLDDLVKRVASYVELDAERLLLTFRPEPFDAWLSSYAWLLDLSSSANSTALQRVSGFDRMLRSRRCEQDVVRWRDAHAPLAAAIRPFSLQADSSFVTDLVLQAVYADAADGSRPPHVFVAGVDYLLRSSIDTFERDVDIELSERARTLRELDSIYGERVNSVVELDVDTMTWGQAMGGGITSSTLETTSTSTTRMLLAGLAGERRVWVFSPPSARLAHNAPLRSSAVWRRAPRARDSSLAGAWTSTHLVDGVDDDVHAGENGVVRVLLRNVRSFDDSGVDFSSDDGMDVVAGRFRSVAGGQRVSTSVAFVRADGSLWYRDTLASSVDNNAGDGDGADGASTAAPRGLFRAPASDVAAAADATSPLTFSMRAVVLAEQQPADVRAVVEYDDTLVFAGDITRADAQAVGHIAALPFAPNGGERWRTMAGGFDAPVHALHVWRNELYAAGEFSRCGARACMGVARWHADAGEWAPLGNAMTDRVGTALSDRGTVRFLLDDRSSLVESGGVLLAVGDLREAAGTTTPQIAAWTGERWRYLATRTHDGCRRGRCALPSSSVASVAASGSMLLVRLDDARVYEVYAERVLRAPSLDGASTLSVDPRRSGTVLSYALAHFTLPAASSSSSAAATVAATPRAVQAWQSSRGELHADLLDDATQRVAVDYRVLACEDDAGNIAVVDSIVASSTARSFVFAAASQLVPSLLAAALLASALTVWLEAC